MTFSNDPNDVAQNLMGLWPAFSVQPTPQDYAAALERQAAGLASPAEPADTGAFSNDPPTHLLAAQVLAAYNAARDSGAIGPLLSPQPDPSAVSAWADGDDSGRADEDVGSGAISVTDPGRRQALAAWDSATPAAARVAAKPIQSGLGRPDAPPAHPSDQFLRPELSPGPDRLVAALAANGQNTNLAGLIADPKTGALSRWRFAKTGNPLDPFRLEPVPVSPQEKQQYLEQLVGARRNYPLGAISQEEQVARLQLQQGVLPGAKGLPVSATASGQSVTYQLPDGRTYVLTSNGHPVRDQNPKNMEWNGGFAARHGAIGHDGNFATFPSEDQAYRASMDLMSSMAGNGKQWDGYPSGTLGNIVRQWSPPSENRTESMITAIMQRTGLSRNMMWKSLTPSQKADFARAYARSEGYRAYAPELPPSVR